MVAGTPEMADFDEPITADPVLVVGAGPVGLVMACELARRRVPLRVIDTTATPATGSRGKGLKPRSMELLDDLGVIGRVLATGRSRMPVRRYRGREVLSTGMLDAEASEPDQASPYTRTMIIGQDLVEKALREALSTWDVRVERPCRLVGLSQEADHVHVVLDSAGEEEQTRFSYVIGCDGAASTVRRAAGIAFDGSTDEGRRMVVGDLEIDGLDRDFWHMWPQESGGLLTLCPLPAVDAFQIQCSLAADAGPHLTISQIQRMIEQLSGRPDIRVRQVLRQSMWRANVRMAERFRSGRVFLAGDAAHVHPPAGGLGMNTGMQDAYNLGWKLAHVLRGAPPELLDTYEAERRPVAADVLDHSATLTARGPSNIVPERGQADTSQLRVRYPDSPLNAGDSDDGVGPGDRAPDGWLRDTHGDDLRLFDVFRGPHLTALAFGPRSGNVVAALRARYPGLVRGAVLSTDDGDLPEGHVRDPAGSVRRTYGVASDTLFVIRPDGYVGFRGDDVHEQRAVDYLARLLPVQCGQR
jgi:2-polyprenyl-6-methoxyphenol hydroxylase-like FAD-dependent oxidoreductase